MKRVTHLYIVWIFYSCLRIDPIYCNEYCRVREYGWNINSDVKLTFMFSMRKSLEGKCGALSNESLQQYIAIRWALEKVNKDNFIPGVNIGLQVYDDCRSETFIARNSIFMLNSDFPTEISDCKGNKSQTLNIGVIGPSYSSTSVVAASLLSDINIPIISPSSTLSSLSDKNLYPTFFRTAVPDTHQVEAIAQILLELEWTLIAIVYTSDTYGQDGMKALKQRVQQENICIVQTLMISTSKISTSTIKEYLNILKRASFQAERETLAVIFFGQKIAAENLLFYANNTNGFVNFHWIMSDSVGQNIEVLKGKRANLVAGTITLSPISDHLSEYSSYYIQLLRNVSMNIMDDDLISEYLKTTKIPSDSFYHNDYVPLTLDAVYALLATLKQAHKALCNDVTYVCDALRNAIRNGIFLNYLRNISVNYKSMKYLKAPKEFEENGRSFSFNSHGDVVRGTSSPMYTVTSYDYTTSSFSKAGYFRDETLHFDKKQIQMVSTTGVFVSGNELPKSICDGICNTCLDNDIIPMIYLEGDAYIVGIFSLHNSHSTDRFGCGPFRNVSSDTILLESFLHAVSIAREKVGINFGVIVFDDCYNPLKLTTTLSTYLSEFPVKINTYSKLIPWKSVVCVIGALSSGVTIPLADFFSRLNIPVVSYAASSADLDDKTNFPFFLRTVPSDNEQAAAMAALVVENGWEYVDLIYVDNNYGTEGKDAFLKMAGEKGICVGDPLVVSEVNSHDAEIHKTLIELQRRHSKVVVFFGIDTRYSDLMKVLNSRKIYGDFIFLVSEEWGTKVKLLEEGGKAARGFITLKLASPQVDEFDFNEYIFTRTLENSENNPWFQEFWQHVFKCNLNKSFKRIFNKECTSDLHFSKDILHSYLLDERITHVRSAVMAVSYGMKKTMSEICNDDAFPCELYHSSKYTDRILANIRNVELRIKGSDSYFRLFDVNGNGAIGFKIFNIQEENQLTYKEVGYYTDQGLTLHHDKLKFYNELGEEIENVDSDCFAERCKKCNQNQIVTSSEATQLSSSTPVYQLYTLPDIILITLVAILIVILCIILVISCCYFKRRVKELSQKITNLENQHIYEPVRDARSYENKGQVNGAKFIAKDKTIKFINPSLNSINSLTNVGLNNEGFLNDDHYLCVDGSFTPTSPVTGLVCLTPSEHEKGLVGFQSLIPNSVIDTLNIQYQQRTVDSSDSTKHDSRSQVNTNEESVQYSAVVTQPETCEYLSMGGNDHSHETLIEENTSSNGSTAPNDPCERCDTPTRDENIILQGAESDYSENSNNIDEDKLDNTSSDINTSEVASPARIVMSLPHEYISDV